MEALCYEGHEVCHASNAVSALGLLNSDSDFAVILCDLQMNGMDGLELLRQLRATYPHIPVVVTSAHSADAGVGELARREADHYLAKPFRIATLLNVIQHVAPLPLNRA